MTMTASTHPATSRVWWDLVFKRWSALRGLWIGGPLVVISALVSIIGHFANWPSEVGLSFVAIAAVWYIVTLPWAMYDVWHEERIARNTVEASLLDAERILSTFKKTSERKLAALEDQSSRALIAAKQESAPDFSIKSVRFADFDYRELPDESFHKLDVQTIVSMHAFISTAIIELENFGASSRASNWTFEATSDQQNVSLTPRMSEWLPPKWLPTSEPLVLLADLDRTYFVKDRLYTIALYLGSKKHITDFDSLRITFADKANVTTNWPQPKI